MVNVSGEGKYTSIPVPVPTNPAPPHVGFLALEPAIADQLAPRAEFQLPIRAAARAVAQDRLSGGRWGRCHYWHDGRGVWPPHVPSASVPGRHSSLRVKTRMSAAMGGDAGTRRGTLARWRSEEVARMGALLVLILAFWEGPMIDYLRAGSHRGRTQLAIETQG